MVYDKLENMALYKGLSADIYEGLSFLKDATPETPNGIHQLNPRVKAIVSEYETKAVNENGYEAHRQYIDIQYLITGEERIACLPVEWLTETKPYSQENDCALYSAVTSHQPSYFTLLPGYFAIFHPQDGHMPQLTVAHPTPVKKVVIKIQIAD